MESGVPQRRAHDDLYGGEPDQWVAYRFKVRAENAVGEGPPSAMAAATSAPGALMTQPGDGQVVLTWDAAAHNGSALTGYQYRYSVALPC